MRQTIFKQTILVAALLTGITMSFTSCSDQGDNPVINEPTQPESYESVLSFFKEINAVPRPSRYEDQMREYLRDFAQQRGLVVVENTGNIIIYKNATAGMEQAPMVCLQTHMDMVCVAADGYQIDFLTQGIEQYDDGQYIWSKDHLTSLGADDGIGMAIVLALLDSRNVAHGPLECVFTWNEEDGLDGSAVLEPGVLKSSYMINIDWEDEGQTCLGTAGGIMMDILMSYQKEMAGEGTVALTLRVNGLTGGHSGMNIVNGGANAIKLMGDFLYTQSGDIRIAHFCGGSASNAIAASAEATVVVPESLKDAFILQFDTFMGAARQQYAATDPALTWDVAATETETCLTAAATAILLEGLATAPQGVMEWSTQVENMFETSNNVGLIDMNDHECAISYYVRGFQNEKMNAIADGIEAAYGVGTSGTESDRYSSYSAWTQDINSPLLSYSQNIWRSLFGTEMQLVRIGAGMEPSNFSVTYPDMQIFCYGPNVFDAHTVNEHVEISSIARTWQFTLELLKSISTL
ncbi:MAG: beta-Ala-His dipeptidase [Bacteroidaceae bacterium]|nr:beta-Ala-His dipeptidase [Bacteroidaceae bacterium]